MESVVRIKLHITVHFWLHRHVAFLSLVNSCSHKCFVSSIVWFIRCTDTERGISKGLTWTIKMLMCPIPPQSAVRLAFFENKEDSHFALWDVCGRCCVGIYYFCRSVPESEAHVLENNESEGVERTNIPHVIPFGRKDDNKVHTTFKFRPTFCFLKFHSLRS